VSKTYRKIENKRGFQEYLDGLLLGEMVVLLYREEEGGYQALN